MATDVGVSPSPKQTIMDAIKTPTTLGSSCTSRKNKGIPGFFSAASKLSVANSTDTSNRCEKKVHTETILELDFEFRRDKERSNDIGKNICSEYTEQEKKKNVFTFKGTKQNGAEVFDPSVVSAAGHHNKKLSTGGKKKSLTTSKKAKEEKTVPSQEENDKTEEQKKDQNEVSEQDEEKNMPQEMDYREFLKTLAQNQNGEHPTVCHHEGKEQPTLVSCPDGEEVQSCSEKSNSAKEAPVKKNKGMAISNVKSETSGHCQTETKISKPSNAFSVLMQARTNKKKEKSLDVDGSVKTDGTTACGESPAETHDSSDQPEQVPAETTSTPSVLNFFSKCTKNTRRDSSGGGSVLVEVDIHHDPAEKKITPIKRTLSSLQLKQVEKLAKSSPETDNEIVFLGSETVEAYDCRVKKRELRKKNNIKSSVQVESSEKIPVSSDNKDKCSKGEEDTDIEKRNAFFKDCTTPDQSLKTAQATLQFGQGGKLAMNMSVIARASKKSSKKDQEKDDDSVEKKKKSSRKGPEKREISTKSCHSSKRLATRMRKRKEQQEIVVSDSEDETGDSSLKDHSELEDVPPKAKNKKLIKQKWKITRLRESVGSETSGSGTGSDSKDFTPRSKSALGGSASRSRAQELLMKARQKKQDCQQKISEHRKSNTKRKTSAAGATAKNDKVEEKPATQVAPSSPEQGRRRQSRRLAEQKVKQAAEEQNCISVDSDSSSDDMSTPQKKTARKKGSSCLSSRNGSSVSTPKKPVGKLAPIFAKKTKEVVDGTPQQPQEDPEVVRKRREFLLSGVPSELKRQAACVMSSVVTSDFAPFPENSHVQQKLPVEPESLDVWSLGIPEKMTALQERLTVDESQSPVLEWASLRWHPLTPARKPDGLKLLDPVSDSLDKEVRKQLIKDLLQTDPGFPFSAFCDEFREQLSAGTTKQESSAVADVQGIGKKSVDTDVIVDELEDQAASQGDRDSQWPERLQPKHVSEMIGNESCIRRLRYWLEEWKALIQREARRSVKSTTGKDSNLDYFGEDSDEESSHLCNTMLLLGPHGVGKTAAVYALAQQLAYKVFEVNASSSRQGRHILAQLQEATQSHQVAQKKDGIIVNPAPVTPSQEQSAEKKASKKNASAVPKAFANFFKKAENIAEDKTMAKNTDPKADNTKKGKGIPKRNAEKGKMSAGNGSLRKRRKEINDVEVVEEAPISKKHCKEKRKVQSTAQPAGVKEGEESNLAGCLNLTSTSLILFDEVDLVFEEDTGFLQTVQHFINTTKIPIVMTTTDPGFERLLNARMETLVFKTPSLVSVTSYLQTVCLAVGMRTCHDDISALAGLYHGDVRRALLILQFLVLSGGGSSSESRAVTLKPPEQKTSCEEKEKKRAFPAARSAVSAGGGDGSDSDGDFVCLKPLRKKIRRIDDDEDGNSIWAVTGSADVETVIKHKEQDSGMIIPADTLPSVHLHLYESVLGVSCILQDLLVKSLKDEYSSVSLQQLTEECLKLRARKLDILQANLLQLLPLPKTTMPGRWHPPSAPSSSLKRKRIRSDIYDSEVSDDENESATLKTVDAKDDDENADKASASVERLGGSQKDSVEAHADISTDNVSVKEVKENDFKFKAQVQCKGGGVEDESMEVGASLKHRGDSIPSMSEASAKVPPEQSQKSKLSLKGSKTCTDHGLGSKLLSSFARYYESLSFVDMDIGSQSHLLPFSSVGDRCPLLPGIEDCTSKEDETSSFVQWREAMAVEIEVCSSRKLLQQVDAYVSSWKDNFSDSVPDNCSIPVLASGTSSSLDFKVASSDMSIPEACRRVTTAVVGNLPLHISSDAITLDYLPALRCISRAERCRQIAKTKRRFHHHFDNIGLCLNQTTVAALCADFPARQQDASR